MKRILILLLLLIVAAGGALFANWESWFGDENPERKGSEQSQATPTLPDLRVQYIPVSELPGTVQYGNRKKITKAVAEALQVMAVDAKIDIKNLARVTSQKKVPLNMLTALPGVDSFETSVVEKLGEDGVIDKDLLKTIARDKMVPLEALDALAQEGRIPSKFVTPFKVLAKAGMLPIQEMEVKDDKLMIMTDVITVGSPSAGRQVGEIVVTDQGGSMVLKRDKDQARWIAPGEFGLPTTPNRMNPFLKAVDGLGEASWRGKSSKLAEKCDVVADEGKRITFKDFSGQIVADLRIGKPRGNPGRGQRANPAGFVRSIGQPDIFLLKGRLNAFVQSNKRYWLDLRLLSIDPMDTNELVKQGSKIVVNYKDIAVSTPAPNAPEPSGENKRLVLTAKEIEKAATPESTGPTPAAPVTADANSKTERKWFIQEPESAKDQVGYKPQVDSMIRGILGMQMMSVVGLDSSKEEYGFQDPVVDITITLEDAQSWNLKIGDLVPLEEGADSGASASNRQRYAILSGNPKVFTISEYSVKSFMKSPKDLEDPTTKAPPAGAPGMPGRPGAVPGKPRILAPDEVPEKKKDEDK